VLATVFIRFLEDNELIEPPYLAGIGDELQRAKDEHEMFFRQNPRLTEREYLEKVFTEVGALPAMKEFFDRKHNPIWQVAPSGDVAKDLLDFWRKTDPETGALAHDFTDPDWNTDSASDFLPGPFQFAKAYAPQTPVFVSNSSSTGRLPRQSNLLQIVRMIDPTCSSGHFLSEDSSPFRLWQEKAGENPRARAKSAGPGLQVD
jgi:hypothetical protein